MHQADRDAYSVHVGHRLRQLREEAGISMRALAQLSGLSANALSMIERGLSSPSVSTLNKLAGALKMPIISFFRMELDKRDVVFCKAGERTRVPFLRGLWEGLGGEHFTGRTEAFMLTLENGGTSGPYTMMHSGTEFVFCLRGTMEYSIERDQYILEAGDSLIFAANLRHRWRNPGNTVANAIIVISSFTDDEEPSEMHLASHGIEPVQDEETPEV